jgi:hypothetical protein
MNRFITGPQYLTIPRYWFENQCNTQHVNTWANIFDSLRIDDESDDVEKLAMVVSSISYRVPRILEQ